MTSPRSLPLVALVIVVGVIGVNARIVAGGDTWSDQRYHTEVAPPRLAAAEAVQSGALPTWWEGTALGVPLAGEPSHGAMYPPTWVAATPRALDWLAILHLVWAALGIAVWARSPSPLRRATPASEPAAVAAALLVVTTGLFASAAVRGALPALAHLPWVGLLASRVSLAEDTRARTRAALGLAVVLGLVGLSGVLAGLVDALVLVVAIASPGVAKAARTEGDARREPARRVRVGALGMAIAGGLAIAAPQWVPAVLHLLGAHAGGEVAGLPPARLLELVVPGSFGSHDPERALAALAGEGAWAPSLFVGAPLLAFAAVRTPALRIGVAMLVFATLALVVGRGGWPHWLGAPELHVAALVLLLAVNAAAGFDALVAGERRAVVALAAGGGFTAVALVALAILRGRYPSASHAIDRALVDGGLGVACIVGALVVAVRGHRIGAARTPLLLALAILPSVGATPSTAPAETRAIVDEPPAWAVAAQNVAEPRRTYRPTHMFDAARDTVDRPAVSVPRSSSAMAGDLGEPNETLTDAIATFAGASGWRWGIGAARSEDPARSAVHDLTWAAASREGGALLDRFGIALAILPETLIVPRKLTALSQRGRWALIELPVAPAAAVMRGWWYAVDPDDALHLMFPPGGGMGFLRGTTVLMGRGTSRGDRGPPLPCTIDTWAHGAIDLRCETPVDGFAVVSSTDAPGWEATIDGEKTDWIAADVMRRAVAIPAGSHAITWRYRAPGMQVGLILAALGLALVIALAITSRTPRT